MDGLDKHTLKEGTYLFKENDEAYEAYLIQQGVISITKTFDGKGEELALLEAGDLVGERALIPVSAHNTSAKVITDSAVVIPIDKTMLAGKYAKTDKLIRNVLECLVKRLEHANAQRFEKKK